MSVKRTIEAICDQPGCGAIASLEPNDSQIYRTLVEERGWSLVHEQIETKTYCPLHPPAQDVIR